MTTWPRGRARDGGVDEIPRIGAPGAGRLWLCGKHAIGPDVEGLLGRIGAERVVCLTERHELSDRYPSYVEWLDRDRRALWHPVHDLGVAPFAEFIGIVDVVSGLLHGGTSVLIHCGAGIGRAGTLAVGVLLREGMRLDDALAHVAAHRPMAGPEVGAQQQLVERYAAHTARRAATGFEPASPESHDVHPQPGGTG